MKITFLADNHLLRTCIFILLFGMTGYSATGATLTTAPDSIGMEVVNNKQVVLHRLEPKETYYGLSRQYNVVLSNLIQFNNNKPLKIGEVLRIPTERPAVSTAAARAQVEAQTAPAIAPEEPQVPKVDLPPGEYIEYIIGRGETLYTVSKRFNIPVESIKLANGLSSDALKIGQVLHVPKKELPTVSIEAAQSEPIITASSVIDTTVSSTVDFQLPPNRYGIREVNSKGLGVWIEDLSQEGASMLALHNLAPVGTVVKVTNPMTNLSTFVKVVGKFVETSETQGSLIVISKSVASIIGILDRRFQIEIAYGAPIEE